MTRRGLEKQIAQKIREIRELYKQVYPRAEFLEITLTKDHISFNNRFWNVDDDYPINYFESDGKVWHW